MSERLKQVPGDWHQSQPNSVQRNPHIPYGPKSLWSLINTFTSADSSTAFPSHRLLAWYLGVSRMTIIRWQAWLFEHKYLEIEKRGNTSNLYTLKNPCAGTIWKPAKKVLHYDTTSHNVTPNLENCYTGATTCGTDQVPLNNHLKEGEPPLSLLSSNFIKAWEEAYRIVNNKTWDITESTKKKVEKWFRENPDTQVANLIRTAIDAWTMDISADEKRFYFTKRCRYSILSFLDQYDRLVDELGHNRPGYKWDHEVIEVLDRVVSAVSQGS